MKIFFFIVSLLISCIVAEAQTAVYDTIYFTDKTIDIGEIIDSNGPFLDFIPLSGNVVSISYNKAIIDSTSNSLYPAQYFESYRNQPITKNQPVFQNEEPKKPVSADIKIARTFTIIGAASGLISAGTFIYMNESGNYNISPVMLAYYSLINACVAIPIGIAWGIKGTVKSNQSRKKQTILVFSTNGLGAQMVLHF